MCFSRLGETRFEDRDTCENKGEMISCDRSEVIISFNEKNVAIEKLF